MQAATLGRRKSHRLALSAIGGALVSGGGRPMRGRRLNLSREGGLFEPQSDRCYFSNPAALRVATGKRPDTYRWIPIHIVRAARLQLALRWRESLSDDEFMDLAHLLNPVRERLSPMRPQA
jgi:hypothetical protein